VVVASLAVGGALLLAMIAASGRAAASLAADARVPIHFGSAEHCYWVSKRVGLVIWPVAGALAFGVLGGVAGSGLASGWVPGVRDVIVPAVLVVLLGFQIGALVLARRGPEVAGGPGRDTTDRSDE
jgi:hypothetical protein